MCCSITSDSSRVGVRQQHSKQLSFIQRDHNCVVTKDREKFFRSVGEVLKTVHNILGLNSTFRERLLHPIKTMCVIWFQVAGVYLI